MSRRISLSLMVLVLLLAAGLRFARLADVPPGVTHDEAAHLHDARRIGEGARPIYLTSGYGREPLYDYATAPLVGLLGMRVFTGRFSAALWGIALVAVTYLALRGPLGEGGAIGTALLMAVSFWPLSTSRQALRSITMPTLFTGAMAMFWRGLYGADESRKSRGNRYLWFVGAGALLGLGFYTYMPARATWGVPVVFWLTLALTDRPRFRGNWRGILLVVGVMVVVAAPLLIHLARHPELEVRVTELAMPLRRATEGDLAPLLRQLRESIGMFSHRGDIHWMYNLSGRPLLPLPLAIIFYVGLALAVVRLGQPGPRLLLLWLAVGTAPALVTGLESCSLRAIAAQPAVLGLCALPFVEVARWMGDRSGGWVRYSSLAVFVALSGWVVADTARDYFATWANHPHVRVAYHAHLAAEAAYLEREGAWPPIYLSTQYPERPHDPAAMDVLRGRTDADLRWFDGRGALVFPESEGARLLVPTAAPLDPALEALVSPYTAPLAPILLRPTDLVTQVNVLEWDVPTALDGILVEARGPAGVCSDGGLPPNTSCRPLPFPIDVGGKVALVGYQLQGRVGEAGERVTLITFWRISESDVEELVLFAHLLEDRSHILTQSDRLDAPVWNWHAGDTFAQVHHLPIPADASPGEYALQVGVYREEGGARLPVVWEGDEVDDRILLDFLEVQ